MVLLTIYRKTYLLMDIKIKEKISQALRGRSKSAPHRKAIAEAMRGLRKSNTHRANLSIALRNYNNNKREKEYYERLHTQYR